MRLIKVLLPTAFYLFTTPASARTLSGDYMPKLGPACGREIGLDVDVPSLKKSIKQIGSDHTWKPAQITGRDECGNAARLLWRACRTPAGLAAVKAAKISRIWCRGTSAAVGSLTIQSGTLTVDWADQEPKFWERSIKQLEGALNIELTFGKMEENPQFDDAWDKLAAQPNPVASTSDYCVIKGARVELTEQVPDTGTMKCWKDGKVVTDLVSKGGRKTGFWTWHRDNLVLRQTFVDGQQTAETRTTDGVLNEVATFEKDDRLTDKELYPDGKLKKYSHKLPNGYLDVELTAEGNILRLGCLPGARDDEEMAAYCGFKGTVTQSIYDRSGKVAKRVSYSNGVMQGEKLGDSEYARGSDVGYKDGQKEGEERVLAPGGKLERVTMWTGGRRDGVEKLYDDSGKKVVTVNTWQADKLQRHTDFFLNGRPKAEEVFGGEASKSLKRFFDSGKLWEEGSLVGCQQNMFTKRYDSWCKNGSYKTYYESGTRQAEETYAAGKRQGETKRWWENGKRAAVEEYDQDKLIKAQAWDKDGKQTKDDEYEADGSRKVKGG